MLMEPGKCPLCDARMIRSSEIKIEYEPEIETTIDFEAEGFTPIRSINEGICQEMESVYGKIRE